MKKGFLLLCALLHILAAVRLPAQNDGALDASFIDPGLPAGAEVTAILPVASGKIYVAGDNFLHFGSSGQYSDLVRLNADGSLDTTFDPSGGGPFKAIPLSLVTQSSGKILVDSVFNAANRANTTQVIRLNTDGTFDATFDTGSSFSGMQLRMLVQADDKIVLVGTVSYVNPGTFESGSIGRLNADGTRDTAFPLLQLFDEGGRSSFPRNAVLQADGKFIVAGHFYIIGTNQDPHRNGVARFNSDGSLDAAFDLGDSAAPDPNRYVTALALQPDGKILIGGSIDLPGNPSSLLARLTSTGALDPAFSTGTGFTAASGSPTVNALFVQADGKIVVGGRFDGYNGTPRHGLLRLNADGSLDMAFDPGTGQSGGTDTGFILTAANDSSGRLLVGGDFSAFGGAAHTGIVRLGTAALSASVTVPGTANPWLAPSGATDSGGDALPAQAPVFVNGLALTPGSVLTFSAAGLVNNSGGTPADPPEGSAQLFPHPAENGLSGVLTAVDGLLGVFVDDPLADPTNANAPATLDYSDPASVPGTFNAAALQPKLRQVFFIGSGQTPGGAARQFTVPAGATHLVLGTMDGSGWYNNTGAFNVAVTVGSAASPALTATVLKVNGSAQPTAIVPGAALAFTATQGAAAGSGVYVRVQAAPVPTGGLAQIPESSWTDLTDTANGGGGFLKGDGGGNYALTTTQYPAGAAIAFRAIAASPGQKDSISNVVGPFATAAVVSPAGLRISQSASTPVAPNASVAVVGDQITYTFFINNDGPTTFANARLFNVLPSHTHLESAPVGFTLAQGNLLTCPLGSLAPTGGNPLVVRVVLSVTSDAFVGEKFSNRSFAFLADGGVDVEGSSVNTTTVVLPLEVVVTSNSAAVAPGGSLVIEVDVYNRTAGKIRQVGLSIPIPGGVNYVSSGFVDDQGQPLLSPPLSDTGGANPIINGTNLLAYFGNLKANAKAHLTITVAVPYDVDPAAAIVFGGPQVTTKTSVGGVNQFTLPDTRTPLSGQPSANPPRLGFSKTVADATGIFQLYTAQPKLLKNLEKSLGALALDPAALAQLEKIYPGLATLNLATATLPDLLAVLNPDVSFETGSVVNGYYATTVAAPTAQKATYVAFVLPYANTGGATAGNVVIQDRVPAGMTLFEPGTGAYNGSILINGAPGDPSGATNLEILDGGRTLRFHLGNVKAGKSGFVLYKARVLGPGEAGAPSVDSVLTSTGSVISSTSLSHTYIGQPDGRDLTVTGRYAYYLEPTQYSSNTTGPDQGVTYETRYVNTGTRTSKILEIDVPVPAGMAYVGAELYDLNHQALPAGGIQAGAVTVPADPTAGTVIFRPPLFTASGKVKPGQGGIIREFFQPLPGAGINGRHVFFHQPFIADGSFGSANRHSGGGPAPRAVLAGPAPRASGSGKGVGGFNATRVDDGALSRVFLASAVPMSMVEGQDSQIFIVEGSTNDALLRTDALNFVLPPGIAYRGLTGQYSDSATAVTDAAGFTTVSFKPPGGLFGHSTIPSIVTVRPAAGAASATPLVFPNFYLGTSGAPQSSVLQTGPVNVRVLTVAENNAFAAMQGQVADSALPSLGTTSPALHEFVSNVSGTSRTIVIAGASALSGSNGAVIVPLLKTASLAEQTLAIGPTSAVGTDTLLGGPLFLKDRSGSFVVMTGRADQIKIGAAAGGSGSTAPQSAGALLAAIRTAQPGNGVAAGAFNLLHGGASNVISNDGGSLVGEDGSSLTGVQVSGVISRDGAGLAAGNGNTSSLVSNSSGTLVSNSSGTLANAALLISQDGNGLVATKGGSAIAAAGANVLADHGDGLISQDGNGLLGTPDNSVALHATASGNLVQVGSAAGIVAQGGGN